MKTSHDPRHIARIKTMQVLFAYDYQKTTLVEDKTALQVIKKIDKIDEIIKKVALERPLSEINKIDLAILRLAVFELNFKPKNPPKVIIDEAIELAKEFGSDSSPNFVNGALGKIIVL